MALENRSVLPPPPLTVRPTGLLDFLSIQSGGRYPQHLAEDLVPTMDLMNWFLDVQAETIVGAGVAQGGAGATGVSATVPSGEGWLIDTISCSPTPVPALVTRFITSICIFNPDGTTVNNTLFVMPYPLIAADTCAFSYQPPQPLWVGPGTPIGLACIASVGAAGPAPVLRFRAVRTTV
jgi:hypothetical protein